MNFPRAILLMAQAREGGPTHRAFAAEAPRVAAWLFLPWLAHIVSRMVHGGQAERDGFGAVLLAVAQQYPQQAFYPVRPCTLEYPFVWRKGGTKRVLEYARLAMGFAHVRASRYGMR